MIRKFYEKYTTSWIFYTTINVVYITLSKLKHSLENKMKYVLLLFMVCILTSLPVISGEEEIKSSLSTNTTSNFTLPSDFLGLADLRATTNSDIVNLEKEAKDIEENRLPKAEEKQLRLTYLKSLITELENKTKRTELEQERFEKVKAELQFQDAGVDPKRLSERLGQIQQSLKTKKILASEIQAKLASMLSPEQQFKKTMSMMFAGLIGIVIVGFFFIAARDEKIRQAIFSGETGIQFLTLFSLVIAIILFGITQILEGKELSALLGGLSGYILGRTNPKT